MSEVVWVIGPSAVGKETFIKTVAKDKSTLQLLGWQDMSIVSCGASYHFNGSYDGDPVDEGREKIFDEIPELLKDFDVVLLKWQRIDSKLKRPIRLQEELPHVVHRAILLVAPRKELAERLPTKFWWKDTGNESVHVEYGVKHVISSVRKLPSSIPVTVLRSQAYRPYAIVPDADLSDIDRLYA